MEDVRPRHIQGNNQVNTKHYCQRCEHLLTHIKNVRTQNSPEVTTTILAGSLQADCALCVQLRRVFESTYGSSLPRFQDASVNLSFLSDGLIFYPLHKSGDVQFYPMQSTELAYPQVVRRIVCPDEPDYHFIRTQLDRCQKFHGQECGRGTVGKNVLRVIDCKSRRLVTSKPDEPYACLSYVWGGGAAQETQSFGDKLPAELPKTIEDAMAVAIVLGIPFLWVDRYCIDQGNLQEKHNIIQNMNKIYEGAEITIIATCGDDPRHGLPGVRGTPRKPQLSMTLIDTTFVASDPIHDEINNTKWAERGWTYQEMLLSRRRLVFTNTQMYFQCRTTHCMESLHPSFTASSSALRPQFQGFPSNGIGHTVDDLRNRLVDYYKRQLSFDTDTINAFKGIVSAFDQSESFPFRLTHFYGVLLAYKPDDENLAQQFFITNLAWWTRKNRHQKTPFYKNGQKNLFPSWSWASTKAKSMQGCFPGLMLSHSSTGVLQCDEVQVCFTHRADGDMDPCTFTKHKDSYEMFLPHIKLTTWVVSCPLSRTDEGLLLLFGGERYAEFQPGASCNTLHLAYLGYPENEGYVEPQIWAVAMILEEMEPGIFCRIGHWYSPRGVANDAWKSTREGLNIALSTGFDEEPVSQPQWEWRTVTIV